MSSKYASGRWAFGISDRSGFQYRLKNMRREWTGLLVGKDEWEAKQPQLDPTPAVSDPQALRDPRPETGLAEQRAIQVGWNPVGFAAIEGISPPSNLVAIGSVGTVSIGEPVSTAPRFDSTAITLDSTTDTFDEG